MSALKSLFAAGGPFQQKIAGYELRPQQERMVELVATAFNEGKHLLDAREAPDGYNIGINVGEAAGHTVMHLHIHLIPRRHGDVANPRGGVRGVIPERQNY